VPKQQLEETGQGQNQAYCSVTTPASNVRKTDRLRTSLSSARQRGERKLRGSWTSVYGKNPKQASITCSYK